MMKIKIEAEIILNKFINFKINKIKNLIIKTFSNNFYEEFTKQHRGVEFEKVKDFYFLYKPNSSSRVQSNRVAIEK